MIFYLGTALPIFFKQTNVPLFVSRRQLAKRKSFHQAQNIWALDSGGFTELSMNGFWSITPKQYIKEVELFSKEIGQLSWAASMDYMCEPFVLKKTGLALQIHQERTIDNFIELRTLNPSLPIAPVLQGFQIHEYFEHLNDYMIRGVDLLKEETVGVGSVCRRQASDEIKDLITKLHSFGMNNLHGFGIKMAGISKIGHLLKSSDSMAWSWNGRSHKNQCPQGKKNCANCLHYALNWRERLLKKIP